jgi:hypothetical protein
MRLRLKPEDELMIVHQERKHPDAWSIYCERARSPWLKPFLAIDWVFNWAAHYLSRWVLLEVLEYLGTFSILIAAIFYFAESGDRVKQKHYQAWQVINTAQGKGGSGGRIDALQELNADKVPLVGIDLTDAFLQGVNLDHADLSRSDFGSADLRDSSLRSANLAYASLNTANLRGSDLRRANLIRAVLTDADLSNANLSGADLSGARLDGADLRGASLRGVKWKSITSFKTANVYGVKFPPPGFVDWALTHGAVNLQSDEQWRETEVAVTTRGKNSIK